MHREGAVLPHVRADYILHPPSGSSYPGKVEANPFVFYPPSELRRLLEAATDPEEARKIKSALKQWERIYVDQIGYPWRHKQRRAAHRVVEAHLSRRAEITGPAINLNYYQDLETPAGFEEILQDYFNVHDNDNLIRLDYNRQGERPVRDIDTANGDFLTRDEGIYETSMGPGGAVTPDGAGPEPAGLENPFPPTGGDIDAL
jgi:hypothetical protein